MLGLIAPAGLAALLVVALPLVIHWLSRRRAQPRAFPALVLLQAGPAGRSQRHRLREWLVLALRCLALLLAVLALAGLVWRGHLLGDGGRPLVLIIDGSASMQQISAGATAWSRAQAAADGLVERHAGRPLALVVADGQAPARLQLDRRPGTARARLAEKRPGCGDGDLASCLGAALAALPAGGGDCFLISDLARTSLAGIDPAALPPEVHLQLVDVGGGRPNCGITGLSQTPGQALVGSPVTINARVANYGDEARTLRLLLQVGDEDLVRQVTVAPGRSASVAHRFTPETSGDLPVSARLTDAADALAVDDQRYGAIRIRPALTAWLVSDADSSAAGALRPLLAALRAAGLEPRQLDGAGLADVAEAAPDLLVSGGVTVNDERAADALAAYLRAGGAWLQVIAGEGDRNLQPTAVTPPLALGERFDVSDQEAGAMPIAQAHLDHALAEPFRGRESLLTAIAAYRYQLTPAGQAADAVVLWAYQDGSIAFAERPVGRGRWLCLNCSTAAADSNLGDLPALPLLLAAVPEALLPGRRPELAVEVGSRLASDVPLQALDGSPLPLRGDQVTFDRPGIFRQVGGRLHAAAVPALESDLRRLDPAVLGLHAEDGASVLGASRELPLWSWLLALAGLTLLVELVLAGPGPARRPRR